MENMNKRKRAIMIVFVILMVIAFILPLVQGFGF